MRQRPYLLLADATLAEVRHAAAQALHAWCDDWGVPRDAPNLDCARAWDGAGQLPADPYWRAPVRAGEGVLTPAWPEEMPAQVQRWLFGSERGYAPSAAPAPIAVAAGAAGWNALLQSLSAALLPHGVADDAPLPPAAADWRHASGAVLLVLRLGKHACHLLLNHAAVARLAPSVADTAPLAPLDYRSLLAAQPVALSIPLGGARVDLGSLARLAVGDVIRLDRAADRALTVRGAGGAVLFDGYLGRSGEYMALELAPHDDTDGVKHE